MTGGIRAPRANVHPALREAVRSAASRGLRIRVLALLAGFPNHSGLSTQLHRTFAATAINIKRWTELASKIEYAGDVLVYEPEVIEEIPAAPRGVVA